MEDNKTGENKLSENEKERDQKPARKKLSYEELEAYVNQTVTQAKRILAENERLKQEIEDVRTQVNFAEINMAFKVLEFKEMFDPEFVQKVVSRLQEVLTPMDKPEDNK